MESWGGDYSSPSRGHRLPPATGAAALAAARGAAAVSCSGCSVARGSPGQSPAAINLGSLTPFWAELCYLAPVQSSPPALAAPALAGRPRTASACAGSVQTPACHFQQPEDAARAKCPGEFGISVLPARRPLTVIHSPWGLEGAFGRPGQDLAAPLCSLQRELVGTESACTYGSGYGCCRPVEGKATAGTRCRSPSGVCPKPQPCQSRHRSELGICESSSLCLRADALPHPPVPRPSERVLRVLLVQAAVPWGPPASPLWPGVEQGHLQRECSGAALRLLVFRSTFRERWNPGPKLRPPPPFGAGSAFQRRREGTLRSASLGSVSSRSAREKGSARELYHSLYHR